MGYFFQAVDTSEIIEQFGLTNYVETGTGIGECLEYALRHPFENFYSVEIHDVVYKNAKEKFDKLASLYGRECEIYHGNSFDTLPKILEELEGGTLFFLDAHFPGADFHFAEYGDTKDYDTRLPLEREVEVITKLRDTSKDVFILDDLWLYEDGPYEWQAEGFEKGECPIAPEIRPKNGIQFMYDLFSETHNFEKSYVTQGFLIVTPKEVDNG